MTATDLLAYLDGVRLRGHGKWSARCPAHEDRSPSLSMREGDRGLLVHCFSGCTVEEICEALNLRVSDLFYDSSDPRTAYRDRVRRTQERQRKERHDEVDGFTIDALREADTLVQSRRRIDIAAWSHDRLNDELNTLADAYHLLESEPLDG